MNILSQLQQHFLRALTELAGEQLDAKNLAEMADMVRPSQDPKFGDYQANFAMPLGKRLGRPPRDVAAQIVERLDAAGGLAEICLPPEIAGPGFINLRLRDDWIIAQVMRAAADNRLGIEPVATARTYVIDYSAPNVAKPMHVGHIRSTVIGAALYNTLKFLGHTVISDNHIGDWGTQFGMIIYGWKNYFDGEFERFFLDKPVAALTSLYRRVNTLVDYYQAKEQLPTARRRAEDAKQAWVTESAAVKERRAGGEKAAKKLLKDLERRHNDAADTVHGLESAVQRVESDQVLQSLAAKDPQIARNVLEETRKLHTGDEVNHDLWRKIIEVCRQEIDGVYKRLGVSFDEERGESAYEAMLAGVVQDLLDRRIAQESEGAVGVFLIESPGAPPFLVQKKDGAFLYATTDLATVKYRLERWQPDVILYVVDHRQSLHFEQLFKTARGWLGLENVELAHVSFGTVLGDDGKPFKTRSGESVGLQGLLDESVERAYQVVEMNDLARTEGPEFSNRQRRGIAEAVGIGAIKYADLSQNRTSDYVFSYDKMLAMNGNTATYMQYAYARIRGIFSKGEAELGTISVAEIPITIDKPAERALALELLRFGEALSAVVADYRPNHLTNYLFALANRYSTFYEQCHVLKAETPELKRSRLALCDLTARTLQRGLNLLGINVVEKM